MADEPTTIDTSAPVASVTTNPPPATPPAAVAKTFTQEEVDSIVKARLERAAKPPVPAPAPKPAQVQAPSAQGESLSAADVQRMITREGALSRAIGAAGLTAEREASVRAFYEAARPEDVSAWWSSQVAPMLGPPPAPPAVATPAATAAPTATPAAPAPAAPAAAPAAPSAHTLPTTMGVVDLFNLQPPQLAALGPQGVRENLEKLWALGHQMSGAPTRPKPPSQR